MYDLTPGTRIKGSIRLDGEGDHRRRQSAALWRRELADFTAFMLIEPFDRSGELVEFAPTAELFADARDSRTRDYVNGRFGEPVLTGPADSWRR
jgi:hypothetical protein